MFLKDLLRSGRLSDEDVARVAEAVALASRASGSGASLVQSGSDGLRIEEGKSPFFTIKITGGTGPYDWVEVLDAAGGTTTSAVGWSGTTSALPAYELGDAADLPVDTLGLAWFARGCGDSPEIRFVTQRPGSFTVEENDGSPSSTTGVIFPNGSLTASGSDVEVNLAADGVPGLVSNDIISAQRLGSGAKEIGYGLRVNAGNQDDSGAYSTFIIEDDVGNEIVRTSSGTGQTKIGLGAGRVFGYTDGQVVSGSYIDTFGTEDSLRVYAPATDAAGMRFDVLRSVAGSTGQGATIITDGSKLIISAHEDTATAAEVSQVVLIPGATPRLSLRGNTVFSVNTGVGNQDGATGTLGPGAASTRGIVTNAGSGSFLASGAAAGGDLTGTYPNPTVNVSSQTLADVAEADSLFGYDDSAAANRRFTVDRLLGYALGIPGGRLTLTSGTPVTTADVTGAGTLYYTPFVHDRVWLYDGTRWVLRTFTERSLSLSVTSGKNYDVFLYDNSGTIALELSAAWTNDTTRADALTTQNGVRVKSGATTRLWLGTLRASGTNACEDSKSKRFLDNGYHQKRKCLRAVDTTDSWNYSTTTWRQANANSANKVEFVDGWAWKVINASVMCLVSNGNAVNYGVGVGLDSTSVNSATLYSGSVAPLFGDRGHAYYDDVPGIGYHYLAWLEQGGSSGTTTWYGDAGLSVIQTGMVAWGEF